MNNTWQQTLTRRAEWPAVGDVVEHTKSGMHGRVTRTRYDGSGPSYATVLWSNGHTGRVSPANIRKALICQRAGLPCLSPKKCSDGCKALAAPSCGL